MTERTRHTIAKIVLGATLAFSSIAGGLVQDSSLASAGGQDFDYLQCTFRVSVFSDWGKAAASTRDKNGFCGNLSVALMYGPGGYPTWLSTKGPVATDYLKTNAGYYSPYSGSGKVGGSVWHVVYY